MTASGGTGLGRGGLELLASECADGVEQPIPIPAGGDQRLSGQTQQEREGVLVQPRTGNGGRTLEREGPSENRQPLEEFSLFDRELLVAPGDGGAQGALPLFARLVDEEAEPVVEQPYHLGGHERGRVRRSELDGQR